MKCAFFLLFFIIANSYAQSDCEHIRNSLFEVIEDQEVVTCRISGIDENRTDILGMFFTMGKTEPAVFVYGSSYRTMLYLEDDIQIRNIKCIQNSEFRTIKKFMSAEQIVNKLMSFKNCKTPKSSPNHSTEFYQNAFDEIDEEEDEDDPVYKTVTIGNQTWMAENLNIPEGRSCYNDSPRNCEVYGGLYEWKVAKKACPTGWRLPTIEDFNELKAIANNDITRLMSKTHWSSRNGKDRYGFKALPGGGFFEFEDGEEAYSFLNCVSAWWAQDNRFKYWHSNCSEVSDVKYLIKGSIRCIKE